MNNIKRIISIGMVVLLTLALTVTVMAEDVPTVTVSSVTNAEPGQTINVDIDMSNNPGILTMGLYVRWDEHLTLTEFVGTETIPYAMVGTGEEYYEGTPAEYELDEGVEPWPDYYYKYYMFLGDGTARANNNNNGTVATLKFKVPNDAVAGTKYPIDVFVNKIDTLNYNRQQVEFTGVSGGITVKSAEPTTYTVTYNAGEGSNAPAADTNVAADTVIDLTKKAEPTAPSGKQFKGWSANGTNIITSLTVTGDVTLTALYEEIPVPTGPVLNGVATRLASSVTIDNVNHTVNVVYDTEQQVYPSGYVCFAPVVDDGVTVTYDSYADFSSTRSRLVNYTVTSTFGSTQFIDLLAEKNTAKPAIIGNSLYKADKTGVHNFNMTLEDGNGATATYAVTLTIGDSKVQANNLLEGITAADFITERESDEVAIDTPNKVITLTTKNMYNYTTIAIDATKVGKDAIDTFALRPRRTMQLLDADSNAKYMSFRNEEVYNKYDRAILLYYVNGAERSYNVRIYGGSDGLSYEDYTLTVVYAPSLNVEKDIKIGRIHNLANAIGNSVAEINETGTIKITYDSAKPYIVFSPVYAGGYYPTISGGEGKVTTEQQTIAGRLRDVYTITTANMPSALKYNVRRTRDTRVYDFEFLAK